MLPKFPKFKPIELSDKTDVNAITSKLPPYSDFNFVSMWSWDIEGKMRLSMLNGNLVVRFADYLTGEPFYSFLGDNMVDETAEVLLKLSKKEGMKLEMQLVPEEAAKNLDKTKFKATEDRNHFDYILDLKKVSAYEGRKFSSRRTAVNKLLKEFDCRILVIDKLDKHHISLMKKLIEKIGKSRSDGRLPDPCKRELEAVKRMMLLENKLLLLVVCIFIKDELYGFSIKEVFGNTYAMGHFLKAEPTLSTGIYSFLMQQLSKVLLKHGCKFINIEQDMGIDGLRFWKESYQPAHFLKKYKVAPVNVIITK